MIVSVDATQVHRTAARLERYADTVEERAELIVAKSTHDVERDAKIFALPSVDTGDLMNSISSDVDGLVGEVGPTVEYGAHVEYGTDGPYLIPNAFGRGGSVTHPGISPQPYMGPAADKNFPKFEAAMGKLGSGLMRGR